MRLMWGRCRAGGSGSGSGSGINVDMEVMSRVFVKMETVPVSVLWYEVDA